MLARPDLVVGVLDLDAELLEREDGVAADVGAGVERRQVEVAALVERLDRALAAEQVVLELGADEEVVEAHLAGALDGAAQHVARVALVGHAFRRLDVGEHARDAVAVLLRAPREHRERRRIGHGDHVRLLDRVEAGDRGAVEAHPAFERVVELVGGDREGLQLAQDVGEPEPDEADPPLLCQRLDVLGGFGSVSHRARRLNDVAGVSAGRAVRVRSTSGPPTP